MEETSSKPFFLPAWAMVLVFVGLAFLLIVAFQAVTGHFGSWLYAWTLLIAAAALGFSAYGGLAGDVYTVRSGRRILGLSLALFVVLALLVELLVFGVLGRLVLGNTVIPLVLLVTGGLLVWRNTRSH